MFGNPCKSLGRFARETSGTFSIEAVLVLPTLFWAAFAMTTFVDGYRQQTMNLRTTYSIADLLSRQSDPVGPRFVDGLGRLHDHLTQSDDQTYLRVTVAYLDPEDDTHRLVWSDSTDDGPAELTQATLTEIVGAIPVLADGDSIIIVETWMDYVPAFNIGMRADRFYNRVVTSPRFSPQLTYDLDL